MLCMYAINIHTICDFLLHRILFINAVKIRLRLKNTFCSSRVRVFQCA